MLYASIILIFIGIVILWEARRRQARMGLPSGRIIYTDTQKWVRQEQALYDAEIGLTGKPDYLVEQGDEIIPVEVKSGKIGSAPYDTHIYQLAAYCLLVEQLMGKRPSHGVLHYPNRTYAIDYTSGLKNKLLELLNEMRGNDRRKELHRSHNNLLRCQACGYRMICDEKGG